MPEFKSAPAIDTPRLALRAHTVDDFADCVALWANPDVTRHITGTPSTPEATWARLLRYAGHWTLLGYGYWAVRTSHRVSSSCMRTRSSAGRRVQRACSAHANDGGSDNDSPRW